MVGILLLIVLVGGVLGWFAWLQLNAQQGQLLHEQEFRLRQNLKAAVNRQINQSVATTAQLNFFIQDITQSGQEKVQPQTLLSQYWAQLHTLWNISAVRFIDNNQVIAFAGQAQDTDDIEWSSRYQNSVQTQYRIVCHNDCFFQVITPLTLDGKSVQVLIESNFDDVLTRFRADEEFELVVFSAPLLQAEAYPQSHRFWNRLIFSASNPQMSEVLLTQAAKRWDWDEVVKGDGVYSIDDTPWAIWVLPLENADEGVSVLLLYDIHDWQALAQQFQQNMLGILLLSLLLTAALVTAMAWSPMQRLGLHAKMLPLLAEHEFDTLRRVLPKHKSGVIDEVDLLNHAIHTLADKWQALEAEVTANTLELKRLAMLDVLTGLPNKAMLLHELEKEIACVGRLHHQVALLYLDLDEFKRINDSLGHSEGDELLRIIAHRLTNSVRDMDTVFRQGGDEFLILLRGLRSEQDVRTVIHKIFSSLQQPIVLGNHKLIVTTSIGVAMCNTPKLSAEELIKHADLAMYQAKAAGRSNYRVFTGEMQQRANNRLMIEQDITEAINEKQLSLFLQPIVALPNGEVTGFEALIRWFHPQRGLIMPANFIPDIEDSNAIILVGNYVLEQGTALLARLLKRGWPGLYLAVNLSAKHYLAPGLAELVKRLLLQHQLPPSSLLLEVTEESVMEQVEQAMVVMQELKELGVRIAIDDFGTGYSSLNYLKQLPFDVLKIDRCFTLGVLDNGVDTHIVNTVIDLAHNLQRKVVAEGIETQAQCDFLAKAGCEYAQGYLYSKPYNEEHILSILDQINHNHIWPKTDASITLAKLGS